MQEFLRAGLPKLIFIGLYAWALILLVNFITGRVMKVAERRDALGVLRGAQLRTLASVIRATGIVIVALLAFLQIMEKFCISTWDRFWPARGSRAWLSAWRHKPL